MGGGSGIYRVNTGNPQVANVTQNGAVSTSRVYPRAQRPWCNGLARATRTINVTIGTGIDLFYLRT